MFSGHRNRRPFCESEKGDGYCGPLQRIRQRSIHALQADAQLCEYGPRAMVSPLWSSKQVTRASCSMPSLANNAPFLILASMPLVGEGGKGFIAQNEEPLIR